MQEPCLSSFASKINHPLCRFFDTFAALPANQNKAPISFLSGDPSKYGASSLSMPERGYEIVRESIRQEGNHGYAASMGIPAFKEAIAKLYSNQHQILINPKNIQINHGVNMGLFAALMAISNEDQEILVPQFGYPFFQDVCPAQNRKAVPYRLDPNNNYEIDLQHLESLINQKTSFIFIINPCNPLGTVFSIEHMKKILALSNRKQVPLVCDEVYFRMVYPDTPYYSFAEVTDGVPVIVLSGIQKTLSVPGWVQGWTLVVDPHNNFENIKKNLETAATVFLHTNRFVQQALPQLLQEVGLFTSNGMAAVQKTANELGSSLKQIQGLKTVKPQGTIYLAVQVDLQHFGMKSDVQFVEALKKEENVNVLPLSIMGSLVKGFRLLTCGNKQLYDQFFERLKAFADRHAKK